MLCGSWSLAVTVSNLRTERTTSCLLFTRALFRIRCQFLQEQAVIKIVFQRNYFQVISDACKTHADYLHHLSCRCMVFVLTVKMPPMLQDYLSSTGASLATAVAYGGRPASCALPRLGGSFTYRQIM